MSAMSAMQVWPRFYRVSVFLFVSLLSIFILDVSIARLRYHFMLVSDLSPLKASIQLDMYSYHEIIPEELQHCRAYDRLSGEYIQNCALGACEQNAYMLSEKRQLLLHSVRASHPIAQYISECIDGYRGIEQSLKVEYLFRSRSCESVIFSSDKTNWIIDLIFIGFLPIGVLLAYKAFLLLTINRG